MFKWVKLDNLSRRRLELAMINVASKGAESIDFEDVAKVINLVGPGSSYESDGETISLGDIGDDCWNSVSVFDAVLEATNNFLGSKKKQSNGKKTTKGKRSTKAT